MKSVKTTLGFSNVHLVNAQCDKILENPLVNKRSYLNRYQMDGQNETKSSWIIPNFKLSDFEFLTSMILIVKCGKKKTLWNNQHTFFFICIQSRTYFSKINRFCVEYLRNYRKQNFLIFKIIKIRNSGNISILFSYIFIGKLRTNLGSLLVVLSKHFSSAVCRQALADFIYTFSFNFLFHLHLILVALLANQMRT